MFLKTRYTKQVHFRAFQSTHFQKFPQPWWAIISFQSRYKKQLQFPKSQSAIEGFSKHGRQIKCILGYLKFPIFNGNSFPKMSRMFA